MQDTGENVCTLIGRGEADGFSHKLSGGEPKSSKLKDCWTGKAAEQQHKEGYLQFSADAGASVVGDFLGFLLACNSCLLP